MEVSSVHINLGTIHHKDVIVHLRAWTLHLHCLLIAILQQMLYGLSRHEDCTNHFFLSNRGIGKISTGSKKIFAFTAVSILRVKDERAKGFFTVLMNLRLAAVKTTTS